MKAASFRAAFCPVLLLSVAFLNSTASAQSTSSGCQTGHCGTGKRVHYGYRFVHPSNYGYGPVYRPNVYHARLGTAQIIRARAEANVLNSEARTQHLYADRLQMDNSVQFLSTRLERKRINNETRFGHLHARGQEVRRHKIEAAEAAFAVDPPARSVDPATGRVDWPMLLRGSYYEKARRPIDLVFHQRSVVGSINPDHFLPMRDWIERIERELKANVAYYELRDYLEAKAFLRSLIEEARTDLPIGPATRMAATQ